MLVACVFRLRGAIFLKRGVALFGSRLNSLCWGVWGTHAEAPPEHFGGGRGGVGLLYWEAVHCRGGLKCFMFVPLLSLY